MKPSKTLFVTVGTTKFPKLIDVITTKEILNTLTSLNFATIQFQTGTYHNRIKLDKSTEFTQNSQVSVENGTTVIRLSNGMCLKYDQYFNDIESKIKESDLVVSHAGAGSCLDVLRLKKPLIAVINDDLMDNHQTELAEELAINGYLYSCNCNGLNQVLKQDFSLLKTYPEPRGGIFGNYLDKCVGFE